MQWPALCASIALLVFDKAHPWLPILVTGSNDPSPQVNKVSNSIPVAIVTPASLSNGGSVPIILW